MDKLTTDRGFWLAFLLTIVTLGIYQWYLVYSFARETNLACKEDGDSTRGLLGFILLSIVTLGIYAIVWQAMLIKRRGSFLVSKGKPEVLTVATFLIYNFLLGAITLGIMPLVAFAKGLNQQNAVNEVYNESL